MTQINVNRGYLSKCNKSKSNILKSTLAPCGGHWRCCRERCASYRLAGKSLRFKTHCFCLLPGWIAGPSPGQGSTERRREESRGGATQRAPICPLCAFTWKEVHSGACHMCIYVTSHWAKSQIQKCYLGSQTADLKKVTPGNHFFVPRKTGQVR